MSILNLSYNQPISHLVCCTEDGYTIYALSPNIEKKICNDKKGGVGIMKMLYRSNISVLVGGGENPFRSKNIMVLWDNDKKNEVIKINMNESIKNVLINRDKIIVIIQKKICIFDFEGRSTDVKSTYANEKGLCALNLIDDKPVLLTLGNKKGEIAIWKLNIDSYKTIEAHNNNIVALAINKEGSLVATASEAGTLIKVFSVETCKQLYEFRRGSTTASIHDLSFNKDSTILACCSSNGTIHLFELFKDIEKTKNTQSMLSGFKNFLPKYFESQWGFKQITIDSTLKMICGFDENDVLHITCVDGQYYRISGKDREYDQIKQSNLFVTAK